MTKASVVPYARMVRRSGGDRGDRGENYLTYTVTSVVSVTFVVTVTSVTRIMSPELCHPNSTVGENYLTYHGQATERTVRAYGTQMQRMEKTI